MITLTRLSGSLFALNADLIERVDATPDTVVTLVDGKKYVVADSLTQVIDAVRRHRGEVIALSTVLHPRPDPEPQRMGTVTDLPALREATPSQADA